MLRWMIVLAWLLLLLSSPAVAAWPNEPANSTPLLDCNFDSPTCQGQLWDVYKSARVTQPGGFTTSPPNALVATLNPCGGGPCSGGIELIYPSTTASAKPWREMFVTFDWRTNAEFEGNIVSGNKLLFLRAHNWLFHGTKTAGFFYLRGAPRSFPHKLSWSHSTGGLDNSHICAADLGLICDPNVSTTPIYPGRTYRVAIYIRASTCTTCRDGAVHWWVNGELNGAYEKVNYGAGVVNEFVWANTWDGTTANNGCCPTRTWEHYIDHLYISAPNGGPPPPVTPPTPPQPTNLPGPSILAPLPGSTVPAGSVEIRYGIVAGATQYILNVHEEGQPYDCTLMTYCSNLPGTSKLITVKAGKKYDFWVQAVDDKGTVGESRGSSFTAQVSVPPVTPPVTPPVVPPPVPTGPAFSNIQNNNESISFTFDEARCPKGTRRKVKGRDTKTITITCER